MQSEPAGADVEDVARRKARVEALLGAHGDPELAQLIELEVRHGSPNSLARYGSADEIARAERNECLQLYRFVARVAQHMSPKRRRDLRAMIDVPPDDPVPLVAAAHVLGAAGDVDGLAQIVERNAAAWRRADYADIEHDSFDAALAQGRVLAHIGPAAVCR